MVQLAGAGAGALLLLGLFACGSRQQRRAACACSPRRGLERHAAEVSAGRGRAGRRTCMRALDCVWISVMFAPDLPMMLPAATLGTRNLTCGAQRRAGAAGSSRAGGAWAQRRGPARRLPQRRYRRSGRARVHWAECWGPGGLATGSGQMLAG